MGTENSTIEREFIPSLREGVDIIRMVFFQKMRDLFAEKYPDREKSFYGMAGGAVMNELFATPNPEPKFVKPFFQFIASTPKLSVPSALNITFELTGTVRELPTGSLISVSGKTI